LYGGVAPDVATHATRRVSIVWQYDDAVVEHW
jgi:hypothetical protein